METNKNLITSLLGGLVCGAIISFMSYRGEAVKEQLETINRMKESERKLYEDGKRLYLKLEQVKRDIEKETVPKMKK